MSAVDENGPEHGGDDIVAAEYVLGVLSADERGVAARRIENDPAFAKLVEHWEADLSPLSTDYLEVEAPASVKAAIDRRLYSGGEVSVSAQSSAQEGGILSSLAFWRGLAFASLAALAIYVVLPLVAEQFDILAD